MKNTLPVRFHKPVAIINRLSTSLPEILVFMAWPSVSVGSFPIKGHILHQSYRFLARPLNTSPCTVAACCRKQTTSSVFLIPFVNCPLWFVNAITFSGLFYWGCPQYFHGAFSYSFVVINRQVEHILGKHVTVSDVHQDNILDRDSEQTQ